MTNLAARVRRYVVGQRLWPHGSRVAAAVSGGGDSVALLQLLGELAASGDLVLAGVVHLNHQLRATADRDEALCRRLAADAAVPIDAARVDVAAAAGAARCSVEVAARDARYAFFEQARTRLGADVVAVAHTRDDQAETVLMRLLRGTGTRGLRGALPRRGVMVRPLLACGRDELRAYLRSLGSTWVEDETNTDLGILRNRVRHDLLPRLARDYRPSVGRILARTADLAHDDDAYLAAAADTAAAGLTSKGERGLLVDRTALLALPTALGRRVVVTTLETAGASRAVRLADVERVLAACRGGGAAHNRVAGVGVERFAGDRVLFSRGAESPVERIPRRTLELPGEVEVPEAGSGWRVCAEGPILRGSALPSTRLRVLLNATAAPAPFAVRGREPGDRLRPVGLGGTKTLQDLFVDRKVPRVDRDRTPVVVDAAGRIVWVVGLALAEAAAASDGADDVVVLTVKRPESPGPEAA
jgi:tRNA(Ile)-lysidine synthase